MQKLQPTKEQTSLALTELDRLLGEAGRLRHQMDMGPIQELIESLQEAYDTAEAGMAIHGRAVESPMELLLPGLN